MLDVHCDSALFSSQAYRSIYATWIDDSGEVDCALYPWDLLRIAQKLHVLSHVRSLSLPTVSNYYQDKRYCAFASEEAHRFESM